VPKDWELVRLAPTGEETVLATGVLTYDVSPAGQIIYTDGKRIFALTPGGEPHEIGRDRFIERVLVVAEANGAA
jgi:hypothetical protein